MTCDLPSSVCGRGKNQATVAQCIQAIYVIPPVSGGVLCQGHADMSPWLCSVPQSAILVSPTVLFLLLRTASAVWGLL